MTSALVNDIAAFSVDDSLADLDSQTGGLDDQPEGNLSIGPFGVFNSLVTSCPEITTKSPQEVPSNDVLMSPLGKVPDITSDPDQPLTCSANAEDLLGSLDPYLQWDDIFNLDTSPTTWNTTPPASDAVKQTLQAWTSPPRGLLSGPMNSSPRHDRHTIQSPSTKEEILSEAPMMLRHFQENILPHIIWAPMTRKSPWSVLSIPAAMIALDRLTYMKQNVVNHANIANLYAILACSAYHLSLNPDFAPSTPSQFWDHVAATAHEESKAQIHTSLDAELSGPRKAKYKEQLMALLSLTTYCVSLRQTSHLSLSRFLILIYQILSQRQRETRCYLVNIEYLIRLRGLIKPKLSRRARLLHCQYTWIRVLTESTLVIHSHIRHTAPREALWSCRLNMEELSTLAQRKASISLSREKRGLDDFLHIESPESESDLNINDAKDGDSNLGDIHLVDSRSWSGALHSTVTGVSETWLSLLSQTTRLVNVTDRIYSGACIVSTERQLALHRRSSYLENMIFSFVSRDVPPESKERPPVAKALNAALVIYFYRRVRHVNPCILQTFVSQVVEAISQLQADSREQDMAGAGTAWPVFMAGCEALREVERDALMNWLLKTGQQSGFAMYNSAVQVMQQVWKQRDSDSGSGMYLANQSGGPGSFSWMDESKQKLEWLLFF